MKSRTQYVDDPLKTVGMLQHLFSAQPPSIIFDIGACEGLDSIRYSRLFPSAVVYAFEPLPENINKIEQTIQRFDGSRVRLIAKALSRKNGTATFHISGGCPTGRQHETEDWTFGNKSSSLIAPNKEEIRKHWPWLEFTGTIEVETITMDDFCRQQQIVPDFLHMDVQGAELEVLAGATEMLRSIQAIWMEVSMHEVYSGQPLADEVHAFMNDHGLTAAVILPEGPQADVLYVRKERVGQIPLDVIERLKSESIHVPPPQKKITPTPSLVGRVLNRLFH